VLQAVPLDAPLAIGLFLVSTAAGAAFLVKLAQLAGSDVALSTTLLLVLVPASVVFMPIVVPLALPQARVSAMAIALPLALTMLAPLVAGLAVHELLPRAARRLQRPMANVSTVALVALIAWTLLSNLREVLIILRTPAIAAALIFIGGAFALGYGIGGPGRESKEVLGLGTAQRNTAAAMVVATQSVRDPDALAMIVVMSLVGFAMLFPIAGLLRRRHRAAALT